MTTAYPLTWPPGFPRTKPDSGGSHERMAELNAAIAAARKELGDG